MPVVTNTAVIAAAAAAAAAANSRKATTQHTEQPAPQYNCPPPPKEEHDYSLRILLAVVIILSALVSVHVWRQIDDPFWERVSWASLAGLMALISLPLLGLVFYALVKIINFIITGT